MVAALPARFSSTPGLVSDGQTPPGRVTRELIAATEEPIARRVDGEIRMLGVGLEKEVVLLPWEAQQLEPATRYPLLVVFRHTGLLGEYISGQRKVFATRAGCDDEP